PVTAGQRTRDAGEISPRAMRSSNSGRSRCSSPTSVRTVTGWLTSTSLRGRRRWVSGRSNRPMDFGQVQAVSRFVLRTSVAAGSFHCGRNRGRVLKLIIEDDEGRKTVVPFVRDEITIGRQEGNTIRLTERNVSRRHARLVKD